MGIINKKISGKQRCELLYATSVIKELGYVPDEDRPVNQSIKQYFLVIYFPFNEHAELRGYKLPGGFETKYDRIYLVDSFFINRIK